MVTKAGAARVRGMDDVSETRKRRREGQEDKKSKVEGRLPAFPTRPQQDRRC